MMVCCGWIYITLLAVFVSVGAFTCGYSIGVTNGIENFSGFLEYFDLQKNSSGNASCTEVSNSDNYTKYILGCLTSFISLGGVIGTLLAAKPVEMFGRKHTIVLSAVLMVIGTVIQTSAVQGIVWMLVLGRLIAGIGYGTFYLVGPLYVAEVSPKKIRGMLTSFIGPSIRLGILFGLLSNNLLFEKPFGWRVSRLSIALLSGVFLICVLFLPKSPRWLMLNGREHEAEEVLTGNFFSKSRQEIIKESKETVHLRNKGFLQQLKLILKWNSLKRLLPCLLVHFYSGACGAGLTHYSETFFCSLGMPPFVASLISSGLNLIGNVCTTVFVDKLGRKPVLVGGGFILGLISGVTATLVYVYNLEEEFHPVVSYLVTGLVCLFLSIYTASWALISWVVTGEVFPSEGRGVSTALAVCMNWFTLYMFAQTFPFVLASLKLFGTLYGIAIINLSAGLFYLFLFPETKGISLEAMENLFAKPWLERVGLCQCSSYRSRKVENGTRVASIATVNPLVISKVKGVAGLSDKQRNGWTASEDKWKYCERLENKRQCQGLETSV